MYMHKEFLYLLGTQGFQADHTDPLLLKLVSQELDTVCRALSYSLKMQGTFHQLSPATHALKIKYIHNKNIFMNENNLVFFTLFHSTINKQKMIFQENMTFACHIEATSMIQPFQIFLPHHSNIIKQHSCTVIIMNMNYGANIFECNIQ